MQFRRCAFTLIELLVVVAIVSLLMSILMPSLSAARRSTRTVLCGTNLRQLATGWALYAQDNQDIAVAARAPAFGGDGVYFVGNGYKYRPRWHVRLGSAVAIYAFDNPSPENVHQNITNKLLLCADLPDWTSERNAAYGYNYQFLGNDRFLAGTQRFIQFPIKVTAIRSGGTVLAADALGTAAEFAESARKPYRRDGGADLTALGNHAYLLDPPRLTGISDRCDSGKRSAPDARHAGKANFVFGDGHVEPRTPEQMYYRRGADGGFLVSDPQSANVLFSGTGRDDDPPRKSLGG
jgi:prepilin-type N-terminal cleavage/methylation domain-containing protein/prepilin-type processing-associated H-X9-DG protein